MDTPDALDLDATLTQLAAQLATLGDTSPVEIRRARALGMLANPQRTLTLFGNPRPQRLADQLTDQLTDQHSHPDTGHGSDPAPDGSAQSATTGGTGSSTAGGYADATWQGGCADATGRGGCVSCGSGYRGMRWNAATATLYLHLTLADLQQGIGGKVEKLGPATLDLLRDWLGRLDRVTIRPVLDTTRTDSSDRHDPPEWMREVVILRDGHCVFPGCDRDARSCDLDHIQPYLSPDDGGPPGQTSTAGLACLCRRHHRLKTFTAWTYQRRADGDYQWTSPHRRTYRVTPTPKH
jgi:hypothetical protein